MIRLLLSMLLVAVATPVAARTVVDAPAAFVSDRIGVRVEGSGPDVVLVPGLSSSPSAWAGTVAAMPGYRWHLVQVKGFAGTAPEANAGGPIAAPAAEEIARYIAAAKVRPAIVGHSMGGTIALMVAARHPGAVTKVMVVDMPPFPPALASAEGPAPTAAAMTPVAAKLAATMRALPQPAWEARLTAMFGTMVRDPATRAVVLRESLASDRAAVSNGFGEILSTDLTPELPRIRVPLAVLYVTPAGVPLSDAAVDAAYARAYAGVKGVRLLRVPDSAHFIMSDNPVMFRRELAAFLAR